MLSGGGCLLSLRKRILVLRTGVQNWKFWEVPPKSPFWTFIEGKCTLKFILCDFTESNGTTVLSKSCVLPGSVFGLLLCAQDVTEAESKGKAVLFLVEMDMLLEENTQFWVSWLVFFFWAGGKSRRDFYLREVLSYTVIILQYNCV